MSIKLLYLAAVAVIVACASSGTTSSASAPRRGTTVLTAEEIVSAHADNSNAHDAVARLRPNWLVEHGVTKTDGTAYATVYVDGQQYGPLQTLRGIPAYQIEEIRYYDVTQAGAAFGIRAGTGGVIEVKTKTR